MPFPTQDPRLFIRSQIESITPRQMGCYGIYNATKWISIGKGDIRDRLLAHLNGENDCITRHQPTLVVTVVTNDMDATERSLILEYRPVCNRRLG